MRVYCIHEGCKHEGGSCVGIYLKKDKAIRDAHSMTVERQKQHLETSERLGIMHDITDDYAERYSWQESNETQYSFYATNSVDEIYVYETEVID